ncbi:High-affnity carbon uptake protein Hat/HatR [Minicystis rosea]|nr:High-affnity carbon uptake protein Hat/HatR [Minicystis rosea]
MVPMSHRDRAGGGRALSRHEQSSPHAMSRTDGDAATGLGEGEAPARGEASGVFPAPREEPDQGGRRGDNPFVGAQPLDADRVLFGRDRERREIVDLVIAERIVVLHAPSGAGKTSILRARGGVADLLRGEGFCVLPTARVGLPHAGAGSENRYVDSFIASMEPAGAPVPGSLDAFLSKLGAAAAESVGTVLIIDPLEEIFTVDPAAAAPRDAFFAELGRVLADRRRWAILALREEYLGALSSYREVIPEHLRATYRLDLLGRAGAREAIEQPARAAGVPFATHAAEKLVDELCTVALPRADGTVERRIGPSVEPVELQVVCHRIFRERDPAAREITEQSIEALASVDTALTDHYDAAVAAAARGDVASERRIRDWIEQGLFTRSGIRGQVMRQSTREGGIPDEVIRSLIDAYILRCEVRRGVDWIELAHDRWVGPIAASNFAWRRDHLDVTQVQAAVWEEHARDDALCLHGAALEHAERWAKEHEATLTPVETAFLAASRAREAAAQERLRMRVALAGIVALLLGVLATLTWHMQAREFAEKQRVRLRGARELVARGQPAPAMKLLLEVDPAERKRIWIELANEALAVRGPRITLRGHSDVVTVAVWSPDGTRIATASDDGTARIVRADGSGVPIVLSGHDEFVNTVSWSPDGKRVVTSSYDGKARVWKADESKAYVVLWGHEGPVVSALFSPDGQKIVTASLDGTARVWNADGSGEPVVLDGKGGDVWSARWSPDGKRVATGANDGKAWVWNADGSGAPVVLEGHTEAVKRVAWSPDGTRLVTASADGTARVWNAGGSGEPVVLRGHGGKVVAASFDPSGTRIVTASSDKTARVWNADGSGQAIVLSGHAEAVTSALWSPDGMRIATASDDNTARVWSAFDADLPLVLRGHGEGVLSARFSPDGRSIVTSSYDGTARVWSAGVDARFAATHFPAGAVPQLSPSLDEVLTVDTENGAVQVWRTDGIGRAIVLPGHDRGVRSAVFSADGKKIVTASEDGTARVWNADGSGVLVVLRDHKSEVAWAAFSPDGRKVVTASFDKTARVWNADGSGTPIILRGHGGKVVWAAFSPDGQKVVTASYDKTARVWNADGTGTHVTLIGHADKVTSAAFSPDGRKIVTTSFDKTARVWNADGTGTPILLRGHVLGVFSAAFSPDGRKVVTGSADETARVWDLDGRERPTVLRANADVVIGAAFSADARSVVTLSYPRRLKLWSLSVPDLVHALETTNVDCLSPDLRASYLRERSEFAEDRFDACEIAYGRVPPPKKSP